MWLVAFILIILIIKFVIIIWAYCRVSCGTCKFSGHLIGKVIIVTGANSGIGFETAKDLSQRGARVILACRSLERGITAKQKILDSSRNKDVRLLKLDLESFASIREFVDNICETEERLDILINNAGSYVNDNTVTDDKLLKGMQVNYFGPFLLTLLLLPLLKKSTSSRIINVSSCMYALGSIDLENLNAERNFTHQLYWGAKLCTMLFTVELERKLKGTGVTVNCLNPGVVNTNMIDSIDNICVKAILKLFKYFFKDSREGAQTSIYLAVSPEVENVSGKYFKDCQIAELLPKAQDLNVARKLWDVSEKIVNNSY